LTGGGTLRELTRQLLTSPALGQAWEEVALTDGEVLFRRGDDGDTFYAVKSGTIDVVTGDGIRLERLGPGASFGELAILHGGVRSATVIARGDTVLRALHRDDFLASLDREPTLAASAIAVLGERFLRTTSYLDYVTLWARLMAEGRYSAARSAIQADAVLESDPNVGAFVHTFTVVVDAIQERESRLARQIRDLQIGVDDGEKAREVAEITESDFFRQLERDAAEMRRKMREPSQASHAVREPGEQGRGDI
jgi:CRP-like cAMP-binding protein